MSWRAYSIDGFGIDMNSLKKGEELKEGIHVLLKGTSIEEDFYHFQKQTPDEDWTVILNEMAEDYAMIYGNGVGWLLSIAMNEKENLETEAFNRDDYNFCYVGLTPYYAFRPIPPNVLHDKDWYVAKFKEYAAYVLEHVPDVDFFSAYYNG